VRVADLEEDHEGRHPDSLGWQVGAPYRTAPPAGFDTADDEVWLDAAALRARVLPLLAATIEGPVSGGRTADVRTAARDDLFDALAVGVRDECFSREGIVAIGFGRCAEEGCFEPGEDAYAHLHPETVLVRHQDDVLVGYVPAGVPDELLADDADWAVPDLYRTIPLADGPWVDADVDVWLDARALCARADRLH
jgi:hypothetical protein